MSDSKDRKRLEYLQRQQPRVESWIAEVTAANNDSAVGTFTRELEKIKQEISEIEGRLNSPAPATYELPQSARLTINWEDGALRLYAEQRVLVEVYRLLTSKERGFANRRGETTFKAPFTPARLHWLKHYFALELEDDDTDLQEEAATRAERFEGYAGNAHQEYANRTGTARQMADVIPFGQPILVGHHSEGRDRNYRARIESNFRKGFEAHDRSAYWSRRADSALKRMKRRETAPAIHRRLERLQADQRKFQRELKQSPESTNLQLWLWFMEGRIAFEQALLAAITPEQSSLVAPDLQIGGAVFNNGTWHVIEKVNPKTYQISSHRLTLLLRISDLTPQRYLDPERFERSEKTRDGSGGYVITQIAEPLPDDHAADAATLQLKGLEAAAKQWREAQARAAQANNARGVGRATRELERLYRQIDKLKAALLAKVSEEVSPAAELPPVDETTGLTRPATPEDTIGTQLALEGFAPVKRIYLDPVVVQQPLL